MPEYLAPGVYVEEVSFRAKTIEGVSTSVTGFVGPTRYGPVGGVPELLTGFADFERIYGGLDPLKFDAEDETSNYLALAVRAFFDNGGTKLYVTRVYNNPPNTGIASLDLNPPNGPKLTARFPGSGGNMTVIFAVQQSQNLVSGGAPAPNLNNVRERDTVFVVSKVTTIQSGFYDVLKGAGIDWKLTGVIGGNPVNITEGNITAPNMEVYRITLLVSVRRPGRFEIEEPLGGFAPRPDAPNSLTSYFVQTPESRSRFLTQPFYIENTPATGSATAAALLGADVAKALVKQGLPALMSRTVTQLLTLSDSYLSDLGFVPAQLRAWDTPILTLPELQKLSTDTLTALKIGPIKSLTPDNLKSITDAPDRNTLRDTVNLSLLTNRADVPFDRLTLAVMESLTDAGLTSLGLDATRLRAFDPKPLKLTELQTLSDSTLQKLEIPALRSLNVVQVRAIADNADRTLLQTAAGVANLNDLADLSALTLANMQAVTDATLTSLGFDAAKFKAIDHSKLLPLNLMEFQALPVPVQQTAGLDKANTITVAKLNSLNAANKLRIANATGITSVDELKTEHLAALSLATLSGLKDASLVQAGFVAADLKAVNQASLRALTLAELAFLPEAALQKIGAAILKQVETLLPLKASDLRNGWTLTGGTDGQRPTANDYKGKDPAVATDVKTGLRTFTDIEEISITAAPGSSYSTGGDTTIAQGVAAELITHCELMRYRVAVLDMPNSMILSEARAYRAVFDSKHAAMYYPWVTILDPMDTTGRREINVPPSGYVTGIYARNDGERSVSKAPANEVLRGAVGLEFLLNKAQQDVLNPDGIDCFRFFPGRGLRLWGARTISSDSEWKYINVRRYFAYLEHSIDKGSQFAVFENNNERLWEIVRTTIEDFLFNEWRNNNLMGTRPADAFFVRCDRSTMTQNDIDNGRLVCLIGVAVNKPAEFVIFRIGQMTADSRS